MTITELLRHLEQDHEWSGDYMTSRATLERAHRDEYPDCRGIKCDHNWVGGDVYSDFICTECGERSDLSDT